MDDVTSVDPDYLLQLARHFHTAQQELDAQITQFSNNSAIGSKDYGHTSNSGSATSHYRDTVDGVIDRLRSMRDEFAAHADQLTAFAKSYTDTDDSNAARVRAVTNGTPMVGAGNG